MKRHSIAIDRRTAIVFLSLIIVGAALFVVLFVNCETSGETLYVDDDAVDGGNGSVDWPFSKIQDAINASEDGDMVRVFDGTYNETLKVTKEIAITGNGTENTSLKGNSYSDVIQVVSDGVNITGIHVVGLTSDFTDKTGSDYYSLSGIKISSNRVQIVNNKFSFNFVGISCQSRNVTLSELFVRGNEFLDNNCGIYCGNVNSSIITDNYIQLENRFYSTNADSVVGILVKYSERNEISKNSIGRLNPPDVFVVTSFSSGINIRDSDENNISNNLVSECENGIFISSIGTSENNSISNNSISRNLVGIRCYGNGNSFASNDISNSRIGIRIDHSQGYGEMNIVRNNVLTDCSFQLFSHYPEGVYTTWHSATIGPDNSVNGKPVLLCVSIANRTILEEAGQIILINCTNVTIENKIIQNATYGITIAFSEHCTVLNSTLTGHKFSGISVSDSANITFQRINCSGMDSLFGGDGIDLLNVTNIQINQTECNNNEIGLEISLSDNISIEYCNILSNIADGFSIYESCDISISNCNIAENTDHAIFIDEKSHSNLEVFPVVADRNWWGSENGPSITGHHTGNNAVSSHVQYDSWLTEEVPIENIAEDATEDDRTPSPFDRPHLFLLGISLFLIGNLAILTYAAHTSEPVKLTLLRTALPLYSRISGKHIEKDIKQQNLRGRIYQQIRTEPGINFTGLKDDVTIGNGCLAYHLTVLQREGFIRSATNGNRKQFWVKAEFPGNGAALLRKGNGDGTNTARTGAKSDVPQLVTELLREKGSLSRSELRELIGVSKPTLHKHLSRMVADGVVSEETDGTRKICSLQEHGIAAPDENP